MTPEEFIEFCRFVDDADRTGESGDARVFFRAVTVGYDYPGLTPPYDDQSAVDGLRLGKKIAKRLK